VNSGKAPAAMRPEDRLAEVAALLARGYSRSRAGGPECAEDCRRDPNSAVADDATWPEARLGADDVPGNRSRRERNRLAVLDDTEPSCDHAVNSREKGEVA